MDMITLDHGSGGLRTARLIEEILVPAFGNAALNALGSSRGATSASWRCAAPSTTCAWPGASRCT